MIHTLTETNFVTPEIRSEFWQLLDNVGPLGAPEVAQIRDVMIGMSTTYQQYFWEDAVTALKKGRAFKSQEREDYEQQLLQSGLIRDAQRESSDAMIAKIAAGEPVPYKGTMTMINEERINEILEDIKRGMKRLDALLTRPQEH